jgi:quinol monooxygenase YgiN
MAAMVIMRFKVRVLPERAEEVAAALQAVIEPSRALDGVVRLDIARDLSDPSSFIATEVYEDEAALERQETLPEVVAALALIRECTVEREATLYRVSESEE